jgi:hypothetical protein
MTMTDTTQLGTDTQVSEANIAAPSIKYEDFISAVPPQLKELYEKNGVKDFDSLAKDYQGFVQLKGKKGLVKPSEDAPEEQKQAYQKELYKEFGVPENGEYEYELPESFKEEWVDKEFLDNLAGLAAENGIGAKAFQELITNIYGYATKLYSANNTDAVKKEWGDAFEANFNMANNTFKKYMGVEGGEAFTKKFGQDPDAIKFFYNLAKANKEKAGVLDDGVDNYNKEDLKSLSFKKTQEAMKLRNEGKYGEADKMHREALDMLNRVVA